MKFEAGDAIDMCALTADVHNLTYTAVTDVTAYLYPYENIDALDMQLHESVNATGLIVNSLRKQIVRLLQYRRELTIEANRAYELITEIFPEYERLCKLYALASKKLPGIEKVRWVSEIDPAEDWIHEYYTEINDLNPATLKEVLTKPGIAWGFLRIGIKDIRLIMQSCSAHQDYLRDITKLFISADGHDILALITELHSNSTEIKGADAILNQIMVKLSEFMAGMTYVNREQFQQRLNSYKNIVGVSVKTKETGTPNAGAATQNLSNSLDVILDYSGLPESTRNKFIQNVSYYKKLPDRTCPEEEAYRVRKELTLAFYEIYQNVFIKSLTNPSVPTVIKMFLNFGYVDAALAGKENTDYLYSIADSLKGDPSKGVYTAREWLTAIYRGEKEPSRNELDTDYSGYLRELRQSNKIDVEEEKKLLKDMMGRLRYEIENVFPVANKITYGRIESFCPVFSDHVVQRSLDVSMVTPASIEKNIKEILRIDFSAFAREVLYTNSEIGVNNLALTAEIAPNYILMPNVGIRGTMWQDIEGRNRSTAARMFLPLFLGTDLKAMLVRLTGEFRWEMCKRIRGVRWSDVTDPSLTSEFFDYLQFFKTNRELSTEVKNDIKTELSRARNIYKSVFVSNYSDWILYESNGSQRLNKYVRKIFSLYCPFPAEIRTRLETNPQYADAMKRYSMARNKSEKLMVNQAQKITNSGAKVPKEILFEIENLKR
jgi:hypothetical protein